MNRQSRETILNALDVVFMELMDGLVPGDAVPRKLKKHLLGLFQDSSGYSRIRKKLETADNDADCETVKALIRTKFSPELRKEMLKRIKALPHGVGGHPPKLNLEQKRQARAQIVELIRESKKEKPAIAEVAAKYNVSYRTMQRVWQGRAVQK